MAQITEDKARELFGDPKETRLRLQRFSESARALSSEHSRLIDEYPDQWVAVQDGAVRGSASSLQELLTKLDEAGVPRKGLIIRYIERNQRALIL